MTDQQTPRAATRLGLAAQLLVIVGLAAILFPAMTPGQAVGAGMVAKLLFLGRMVVLLVLATLFLRLRGLRWADMGLRRPQPLRLILSVLGGLVATGALVAMVRRVLHSAGAPEPDYSMFAPLRGNLPEYLFWALPVTLGSAAFGEEMLFRGFIRDTLQRLFGAEHWLAVSFVIVAQAALFGVLHLYQGWSGAVTAGTVGLAFGFVWLASGRNLWAGIILHAVFDLSSMTVMFVAGAPAPH